MLHNIFVKHSESKWVEKYLHGKGMLPINKISNI